MKKKFISIAGVTLIEILIGIVISTVMMGAMYTSYAVVNSSYSQITDRAKISQSGRDVVAMMMRDVRMAGYKYFNDSIQHDTTHHSPIIITKRTVGPTAVDCDKLEIVYGGIDYNPAGNPKHTFTRYKITYKCIPSKIIDKNVAGGQTTIKAFALWKSKVKWKVNASGVGSWANPTTDLNVFGNDDNRTYADEKVIEYVSDLVINAVDENGRIIDPPPTPTNATKDKIYKIKTVDIGLTMRSKNKFFKNQKQRTTYAIGDNSRNIVENDKYLRDSITVSAHARNLGLE